MAKSLSPIIDNSQALKRKPIVETKADQVKELRIAGHSFREIASMLGLEDEHEAYKLFVGLMVISAKSTAHEMEYIHMSRLEEMHNAVWDNARNGDERAIAIALKILEQQRAIIGQPKEGLQDIEDEKKELMRMLGLPIEAKDT